MKLDLNALTCIAYGGMQAVGASYDVKKPLWADLPVAERETLHHVAQQILDLPAGTRPPVADIFPLAKTKPEQVMSEVFIVVVSEGRYYLS